MKPTVEPILNQPTSDHRSSYHREVVQYYDQCEIDYKLVWHLGSHHAMHYGYWKKGTKSLREALLNSNLLVAEYGQLSDGMHVLDAGCGVGGTSIHLAKISGAKIHGISLSEKQIATAQANSSKAKFKGKAVFSVADYTETGFKEETFDLIYGIESVCHAEEKEDFLREAYRLLKPGSRLVILDFFRNKGKYVEKDDQLVKKWANTWAVSDFEFIDNFIEKGERCGFKTIENQNITSNIHKSARRLYWYFYPGWMVHQILAFLGIRNKTQSKNLWSTYHQYKALKKNLWSYHMVVMEK